jgi:hypothetical protein
LIEVAARRTVKETNTEEVVWTAFLARKGWAASVLDGGSSIFHSLNGAGLLHLTSKHEKADYLRLFCAYVWGDDGPFKVIEDTSQIRSLAPGSPPLPPLGPPEFSSARSVTGSESILAHAFIRYSNFLFEAWFEIATSGEIVMKADKPLCELDRNELPKYESSFRSGAHAQEPDYGVRLGASVDEKELKALIPNWELPFRQKTVSFGNAFIDLTDASCGTLEDADGTAWGSDVTLRLENFTFSRIAASSDITDETIGWPWNVVSEVSSSGWATLRAIGQRLRPVFRLVRHWLRLPQRDLPNLQAEVLGRGTPSWFSNLINSGIRRTGTRDRLRWLEQREVIPYPRDRMKKPRVLYENFLPQPYAHLAKVFRDQGDDTTANEIEEQRIRIEHWLEAKQSLKGKLLLPWWGLFGIGFRYGLSPIRAIVTFVMFLLLGWAFVAFANHQGLLVQSSSIAATVVKTSPSGEPAAAVPYTNAQSLSDFPCGNSISQPLYAVDVFIPLLDLRQEARCDIRSIGQSDITGWQAYTSNHRWIGSRIRSALRAWMIYPSVWQWLKALYAVVGWVVTSLTILTLSGTLRKWGQE